MALTVYAAIGDVHGRLDLLKPLDASLNDILEGHYPTPVAKRILFLSDRFERRPYSELVLDSFIEKGSKSG